MKLSLIALSVVTSLSAFADVYTPSEAFADLASERLSFVGRDYPNADLGPGGNYVCIYKNSRIYVRHEGCRPTAAQKLSVFSAKIISRNGGLVEVYIEDNRSNYNLEAAGPDMDGTWKLTSTNIPTIEGELTFTGLISLERTVWNKTYNTCWISKSSTSTDLPATRCIGNASDPSGNLETVWHDPFANGLREAHNTIINAPRR